MVQSVHFAMQTYRRDTQGHLTQAQWKACETAEEAIRRAEAVVSTGKAAGAAAVSQRCSGEFDEGEQPITLAAFGEVPAEALAALPF